MGSNPTRELERGSSKLPPLQLKAVCFLCKHNKEETTSGHRYGKTPEKKDFHLVHNLKKKRIKKHFKGIHDRFLKDPEFRTAMLEHDRDEEVCIKWYDFADKDFSHYRTE